jgi:hypothetical protein
MLSSWILVCGSTSIVSEALNNLFLLVNVQSDM